MPASRKAITSEIGLLYFLCGGIWKMSFRDWMANCLLIALAVAFIVHFVLIAINGAIEIREPNLFILVTEVAGLVGCVIFALVNLIRIAKRQ